MIDSRSAPWGRLVRTLIAATAAVAGATALAQESADDWVIPPGQDAALRALVGADGGLAGCSLELADAQRTEIRLEYRCAGVPHRYVLRHVGDGPCAAFCTQRFAVSAQGATLPDLTRALQASVRSHEAGFEFVRASAAPRDRAGRFDSARIPAPVRVGIAVGVAAALTALLRGGRSADRRETRAEAESPDDGRPEGGGRGD